MATVKIKDNKVYLIGFDQIKDEVYVIERLGGIQLTNEKPDTECPVFKYQVETNQYEKIIDDLVLAKKLIERGFEKDNVFIYLKQRYTCNNLI